MRTLYLLSLIYIGLFLSSCSFIASTNRETATSTAPLKEAAIQSKDPLAVAVYTNNKQPPNTPYTVVGKAAVSKYNPCGIKRQEATIHDAMRTLAASMGGDAVINLNKNDKIEIGTVIAYQKAHDQNLHKSRAVL